MDVIWIKRPHIETPPNDTDGRSLLRRDLKIRFPGKRVSLRHEGTCHIFRVPRSSPVFPGLWNLSSKFGPDEGLRAVRFSSSANFRKTWSSATWCSGQARAIGMIWSRQRRPATGRRADERFHPATSFRERRSRTRKAPPTGCRPTEFAICRPA